MEVNIKEEKEVNEVDYEKESIEILQTFASNIGLWILDSGGKDSSVLKHIALS